MKAASDLKNIDLDIDTTIRLTIKELEPGDMYIRVGHLRGREGINPLTVRRRTEDPYESETFLGAKVMTFPSERVFKVKVLDRGRNGE